MTKQTERQKWEAALAEHFAREWAANRLLTYEEFSLLEKFRYVQTGITISAWLTRHGRQLIQEREILRESLEVESQPRIVILSNMTGLAAAQKCFEKGRPPAIFYFTPESFDSFLAEHPDETQRWHVVYTCYLSDELDAKTIALAGKKYKLRKTEQYVVHYEISTLAPLFERGIVHLWKWNGRNQTLLEEGFQHWVS
jgi:hypothetical protein